MRRRGDAALLRRFGLLVVALAVVGLVMAFWADWTDSSGGYRDAAREVGGALVSGAVLAVIVVWFEDRREADRIEREEDRAEETATRAWKRELEFRILNLVYADLWRGRMAVMKALRQDERPTGEIYAEYAYLRGEVKHLIKVLGNDELIRSWHAYDSVIQSDPSRTGYSALVSAAVAADWNVLWLAAEEVAYFVFRDVVDAQIPSRHDSGGELLSPESEAGTR